ncbi:MAG: 2-oxoacid:acceptor oxidoreductase family protein, partial [Synergistota bacterium]|nr:2-oxoacid:acceptor oxidoreductase family protein [Synergistota bacterium]
MSRANEYFSLVLAGVGGQGLVTMGTLLGEAAVIEGRNACMSSTYGTEARGSFTRTDVIVGDGEIDFIGAESPRLVLCLAQEALDRCLLILEAGDEDAIFLYDSGLVTPSPDIRANSACAPFARIASEM